MPIVCKKANELYDCVNNHTFPLTLDLINTWSKYVTFYLQIITALTQITMKHQIKQQIKTNKTHGTACQKLTTNHSSKFEVST